MQGLPFRAGLMAALRLGLVGLGTIARNQHLGAIAATPGVMLAAVASHGDTLPGLPGFASLDAMLASKVAVDAVVLCPAPHGETDLDLAPLTLVADAFLLGRCHTVEPFLEG